MKARLMTIGGFILGLGFVLIWSPSIPNLVYGANQYGASVGISVSQAISVSFWFLWAGIVLFPVGLAILVYGIGAQKSSPEPVSTETASTETGI
ncbi:MAG: hypothetical protein ACLP9K_00970 [Nitrososphaerales archaeon]